MKLKKIIKKLLDNPYRSYLEIIDSEVRFKSTSGTTFYFSQQGMNRFQCQDVIYNCQPQEIFTHEDLLEIINLGV